MSAITVATYSTPESAMARVSTFRPNIAAASRSEIMVSQNVYAASANSTTDLFIDVSYLAVVGVE